MVIMIIINQYDLNNNSSSTVNDDVSDDVIATHFLDLSCISIEREKGRSGMAM